MFLAGFMFSFLSCIHSVVLFYLFFFFIFLKKKNSSSGSHRQAFRIYYWVNKRHKTFYNMCPPISLFVL